MALKQAVATSSGDWFKPEDHVAAVALLWEIDPRSHRTSDRPNKFGNFDQVIGARVTTFSTLASLDDPSLEAKPVTVNRTTITKALKSVVDQDPSDPAPMTVLVVKAITSKFGTQAYVVDPVDQATFNKVAAWVERRDSARPAF